MSFTTNTQNIFSGKPERERLLINTANLRHINIDWIFKKIVFFNVNWI
jgi:hypothetical protein